MPQPQRLAQAELHDLVGPRREWDVPGRCQVSAADDLLHLGAHGPQRDSERRQRLGGDALALVDEAEQEVLGADVVVAEVPSFLLGQDGGVARPVGEPRERVFGSGGWPESAQR